MAARNGDSIDEGEPTHFDYRYVGPVEEVVPDGERSMASGSGRAIRTRLTRRSPHEVPEAQAMIRRLCELQAEVCRTLGYDHPADCFCGESGFWPLRRPEDYRNDGLAIKFIEQAVREKLEAT